MSSVTLSRRVRNLHSISLNNNDGKETKDMISDVSPTDIDKKTIFQCSTSNQATKMTRASTYTEERRSSASNNNGLKHLCSRFIRRFSIKKDDRTRSQDMNRGLLIHFKNYKSFASTIDDSVNDFEWPDFESVYDSIPLCLAKTLPGPDDFSNEDNKENSIDSLSSTTDEINDYSTEQINLFGQCKRGKYFRRNALCRKLDKSQYKGQLNTFIQQIMIEKLMRTWT